MPMLCEARGVRGVSGVPEDDGGTVVAGVSCGGSAARTRALRKS